MKQLLQNNNTGDIKIEDVPIPQLQDNFIIVQNLVSLISSGISRCKSGKFRSTNKFSL